MLLLVIGLVLIYGFFNGYRDTSSVLAGVVASRAMRPRLALVLVAIADLIAPFVKKCGIADKVKHRKLIIPGYAAVISGELEEELPDWKIQIGPREASHIPAFVKMWKPE